MTGMEHVHALLTNQFVAHVTHCLLCAPRCDTAVALAMCIRRMRHCPAHANAAS